MLESGIALQEAMQGYGETPEVINGASLQSDIYNALSDVCFERQVEKGLGPVSKEEMEAALNYFLAQFFSVPEDSEDDDFGHAFDTFEEPEESINEGTRSPRKRKSSRKLNEGKWVYVEPSDEDYPERWYYCPYEGSNAIACSVTKRPGNKYGDRYEIRSSVGEAKPAEVLDSLEGAQAMAVKMFGESLKRKPAKRKIK